MDDRLRELMREAGARCAAGDYAAARPLLEAATAQHAGLADAWHLLGTCCHHAGDLTPARAAFGRALQLNPRYTEAALNLAVLLNDVGEYDAARDTYQRALAHAQGAEHGIDRFVAGKIANLHATVAQAYRNAGRPDLGAEELRRGLALCPDFADLRTRLAALLMEGQAWQDAAGELRRALEDRPGYLPARVSLGVCCYSMGRREEAVEHWRRSLAEDPHNARAGMYLRMVEPEPETHG